MVRTGPAVKKQDAAGDILPRKITQAETEKGNRQVDEFAYVTDIMPTILEIANIEHPKTYRGGKVAPMHGKSITGIIKGEKKKIYGEKDVVAAEMASGRWVRQGNYEASNVPKPYGDGTWHLYDIKKDLGETINSATPFSGIGFNKSW